MAMVLEAQDQLYAVSFWRPISTSIEPKGSPVALIVAKKYSYYYYVS